MSLQVKLVNAVLSHDTEFFSNMVTRKLFRTLIVYSRSDLKNIDQKQKTKLEKDQSGTKPSTLVARTI